MREDMFEIIIERPRYGSRWMGRGKGRYGSKKRSDPESLPLKEPMWFRGKSKCLNENLAPLVRFLERRVGRPWSAVWSELRERISANSQVQKHVMVHVLQFVEQNPVMIEGVAHLPGAWGSRRDQYFKISGHRRWGKFYVCPRTGLLRSAAEDEKRRAKGKPKAK